MAVRHGWGMANRARSLVYQPLDADEVAEALSDADARGLSVTARGAGQSYGDAALNQGGALVEVGGIRKILLFDTRAGVLRAEAGTTVGDVWRHTLPAGWWPAVVPGGMDATLGGCVAMDVHGKNHVRAGAFGRYVEAVTLVDSSGTVRALRRSVDTESRDRELTLDDVIGAQGLTGTVVDVTIRLRRVHAGFLEVEASATRSLGETFDALDRGAQEADHTVAWVDCTTRRAGRGVVRHGRELPPDHSATGTGLDPESQYLPALVGGILPAPHAWRALRLFGNRPGIQALNAARYLFAAARGTRRYMQGHAAFHFSLDSIPDWKRAYGMDGLVQYQMFVPGQGAREAFGDALSQQRKLGVPSYLAVMARHLPEGAAAKYALDGYSLAMDFPVARGEAYGRLMRLLRSLGRILEDHGGRLYAAKDAVGVGRLPERRDRLFSSNLVRRWERGLH